MLSRDYDDVRSFSESFQFPALSPILPVKPFYLPPYFSGKFTTKRIPVLLWSIRRRHNAAIIRRDDGVHF
jgi:hypothetical protein